MGAYRDHPATDQREPALSENVEWSRYASASGDGGVRRRRRGGRRGCRREVVHPLVLDEPAALEQTRDRHVVGEPPALDGVDVEQVVIERRVRRDGVAAAVVPAVADRQLEQVGQLDRVVVAVGELQTRREPAVLAERAERGHRVRDGSQTSLQARGEPLGDGDRQTDGRDVDERATVDATEVDVDHLAVEHRRDRGADVGRDLPRSSVSTSSAPEWTACARTTARSPTSRVARSSAEAPCRAPVLTTSSTTASGRARRVLRSMHPTLGTVDERTMRSGCGCPHDPSRHAKFLRIPSVEVPDATGPVPNRKELSWDSSRFSSSASSQVSWPARSSPATTRWASSPPSCSVSSARSSAA